MAVEKLKAGGLKQDGQKEENKTTEVTSTSDWQTYQNEKYGFTIVLPASWKDYRVTEDVNGVTLGVKDQDKVFSITAMTKAEYADCLKGELCPIVKIAQNSDYVFVLGHAQDYTDSVVGIANQAENSVVSTFKFTR